MADNLQPLLTSPAGAWSRLSGVAMVLDHDKDLATCMGKLAGRPELLHAVGTWSSLLHCVTPHRA
jgi:hypothetical protein